MQRKGSAVWRGGLKDGQGTVSTETGVLRGQPYTFRSRFEDGGETNPEELIAAAHAGCFSMAFSAKLNDRGITADELRTTATITIEGGAITKIHLDLDAKVTGGDDASFQEAAKDAKENCPVSKLFKAEITLDAKRSY